MEKLLIEGYWLLLVTMGLIIPRSLTHSVWRSYPFRRIMEGGMLVVMARTTKPPS